MSSSLFAQPDSIPPATPADPSPLLTGPDAWNHRFLKVLDSEPHRYGTARENWLSVSDRQFEAVLNDVDRGIKAHQYSGPDLYIDGVMDTVQGRFKARRIAQDLRDAYSNAAVRHLKPDANRSDLQQVNLERLHNLCQEAGCNVFLLRRFAGLHECKF